MILSGDWDAHIHTPVIWEEAWLHCLLTTRMTVSRLLNILHLYIPQLQRANNNGTYGILTLYPQILFIFEGTYYFLFGVVIHPFCFSPSTGHKLHSTQTLSWLSHDS